jgi:hypothetical protein
MKFLILLITLVVASSINSQIIIIESSTLDSLIFNKINEYRISVGSPKFKAFEDSEMRAFSYRVTRKNSTLDKIKHTDSCAYFHNVECVYNRTITHFISEYENAVKENNLEYFADFIVNAWINSPSHRHGISYEKYYIATVTTRITLDPEKKIARLDASYHALSSSMGTKNGYVYKPKNPSIR